MSALDLDAIEAWFEGKTEHSSIDDLGVVSEWHAVRDLVAALRAAEAERDELRAKVAAVEAIHGRTHWCFGGDDLTDLRHDAVFEPGTKWWPCPTRAALAATTGEG